MGDDGPAVGATIMGDDGPISGAAIMGNSGATMGATIMGDGVLAVGAAIMSDGVSAVEAAIMGNGALAAGAAIMDDSLPIKFFRSSRCCFLREYRRRTNTNDSIHVSVTTPSTTTRAIAHVGKPFPPLDCAFDKDVVDSSDEGDRESEFMDALEEMA